MHPPWMLPISPSISARGVSAATESIAMMSTALERTSWSTTSSAISPLSGWHRMMLFTSRPILCRRSSCKSSYGQRRLVHHLQRNLPVVRPAQNDAVHIQAHSLRDPEEFEY